MNIDISTESREFMGDWDSTISTSVINDEADLAELFTEWHTVIVLFWAPWCAQCKDIVRDFEKYDDRCSWNAAFAKLHVDENEETKKISSSCAVKAIPTVIIFKNGRESARETGQENILNLLDVECFL